MSRSTYVSVSGLNVKIGNSAQYASFHHEGTSTIPIRRVVDITEEDLDELEDELKRGLEE